MSIRLIKKKVPKRYGTYKMPPEIKDIACIYGLLIYSRGPDPVYTFGNRKIFLQVYELHRHKTSGRIFRITEKVIDVSSYLRISICKELFYKPCRHLFHKIRRIISHQVIDDVCRLAVGKGCYDFLFYFHRKKCKHIRRDPLRQNPEHFDLLFKRQLLKHRSYVRFVPLCKFLSDAGVLFFLNKSDYFFHCHFFFHYRTSF